MSQPTASPQPMLVQVRQKQTGIAYLFWFFLGVFGGHQFYLGKTGRGLLYLFTVGIFGVGVLIDLFTLPSQVRQVNTQLAIGIR
ncbi:TM2 domain-containing protein [Micromonospora soli]|uniref:TM2 domain-containing protein n=1 Tax=Micromonospora sp. NBRC 110009 TaxID=3061627 RepID=UPI002671A554|nr:TM2 domain-containing protein [Micromonospora sp. NBRC 110009]WKU00758.1 TM2 domain-containing protein [Micromonospora sp. NBRC 110009]